MMNEMGINLILVLRFSVVVFSSFLRWEVENKTVMKFKKFQQAIRKKISRKRKWSSREWFCIWVVFFGFAESSTHARSRCGYRQNKQCAELKQHGGDDDVELILAMAELNSWNNEDNSKDKVWFLRFLGWTLNSRSNIYLFGFQECALNCLILKV